jgi:hypothetical protein
VIAAGIATSMAQVYSVNAVGYVNKVVPKNGLALISNPLNAGTNTVKALFSPAKVNNLQVFVFVGGVYKSAIYDDLEGSMIGDAANLVVNPGNGVFVKNPTASDVTITFVGEVPQGAPLKNPIVPPLSIMSSQVPQAGDLKALGLPGNIGDQAFRWDTAGQKYVTINYDDIDGAWPTGANNTLAVGDAFFLKTSKASSWDRTFSVSP